MWYVEDNRGYITASKLKLFMKSKEAYKKVYVDEVDTSFIKDSKSLENGTIVDSYILTPEQFKLEYAILEGTLKADLIKQCLEQNIPVEKSDKVEDLKAKLVGNKQVLTDWEVEMVKGIEAELKRQPLFDFFGKTENQKEIIVEYKGLKLKAKMDRLDLANKKIRDLKTSKDIEFSRFLNCSKMESELINNDEYQYGFQLAFYALLCKVQYGEWFDWILDCVKTSGNYAYSLSSSWRIAWMRKIWKLCREWRTQRKRRNSERKILSDLRFSITKRFPSYWTSFYLLITREDEPKNRIYSCKKLQVN